MHEGDAALLVICALLSGYSFLLVIIPGDETDRRLHDPSVQPREAYAGENTMSYFSQMVGLCAQNFLAGAAGLAVGVAFIRGLARQARN